MGPPISIAPPMVYEDMRVLMRRNSDGLYTFEVWPPSGLMDSSGPLERSFPPFSPREMEEALISSSSSQGWIQRASSSEYVDPTREIGSRLFTALFGGESGHRYLDALAGVESRTHGLCLRLVVNDRELTNIPWELLYDVFRDDFVALRTRSALVREWLFDQRPVARLQSPIAPPFRVLLSGPDPTLQDALRDISDISLETQPGADAKDLLHTLNYGPPYHALHLIGPNGDTEREFEHRQPNVWLQMPSGPQPIPLRALLEVLGELRELRLIYVTGGRVEWLAGQLSTVVPNVIGVRGPIDPRAGDMFAEALYRAILAGQPLEQAATQGRQAVDFELPGTRQWCSAVVYMQPGAGQLLASSAGREAEAPVAPPTTGSEIQQTDEQRRLQLMLDMAQRNLEEMQHQLVRYGPAVPLTLKNQIEAQRQRVDTLKLQLANT